MIKLVVLALVCSAAFISTHPVSDNQPTTTNNAAEVRRLVHQANWAAVATISTWSDLQGYPMASVLSVADGAENAPPSGEIFFYIIGVDHAALDTDKNNKITFLFTDAQVGKCNGEDIDPYEHQCAKAMISGEVKKLEVGSREYTHGNAAFLSRHPKAASWLAPRTDHKFGSIHTFFLCKLDIKSILLFSRKGYVSISPDEFRATADAAILKE